MAACAGAGCEAYLCEANYAALMATCLTCAGGVAVLAISSVSTPLVNLAEIPLRSASAGSVKAREVAVAALRVMRLFVGMLDLLLAGNGEDVVLNLHFHVLLVTFLAFIKCHHLLARLFRLGRRIAAFVISSLSIKQR